MKYAILETN